MIEETKVVLEAESFAEAIVMLGADVGGKRSDFLSGDFIQSVPDPRTGVLSVRRATGTHSSNCAT